MLTPQHSFGSISQRNRCVLPGNARVQTTICADARLRNLQDVACALAHLDRGRGSCAARIQEWLSPRCRGSRLRAVQAAVVCSRPRRRTTSIRYGRHRTAHLETDDRSACVVPLEAEQQCAARCMLACGAGLFVPSVGKFQTAEQIACCDAERAFSKPRRFEAADSQCSVLDRSSPVPPGSIASNRSTFGGGEGWIKRSQDSAISSQVRFSDSLRVKCAIRSHSAAFARYSSFLFMGRFRQWLSFASIAKRAGCSDYSDTFRTSRRRARRTGKTDARRLAAVGNNLRAPGRGYFFIRLFLRPWADCGCWVCCATRGIARAACGARLSRSVA